MGLPPRLVLATKNLGKIREILRICRGWPVEWLTYRPGSEPHDRPWPDVEETGLTYSENALKKARAVAGVFDTPAVADDSGIEVDALDGAPGPHSARFAGKEATDEQNLHLLIERLKAVPNAERTARYRCVAICAWPDGRTVLAEATCEGRLVLEPRGDGGFGYDPIFVPDGSARTMGELAPDEKDALSHRGKAFRQLGELIESG